MSDYAPKLTFMTANKSSKQKFFLQGRNIANPGYGTLVNSKVVSKNYDFYLIAQHCNRGTVKPVHFKVLFTDSKIEEGVLQEFKNSRIHLLPKLQLHELEWFSKSAFGSSIFQQVVQLCG